MHSANSERPSKGALHPIQESAQTAQAVSEISKGLQCVLTAITIVALWQLPYITLGGDNHIKSYANAFLTTILRMSLKLLCSNCLIYLHNSSMMAGQFSLKFVRGVPCIPYLCKGYFHCDLFVNFHTCIPATHF